MIYGSTRPIDHALQDVGTLCEQWQQLKYIQAVRNTSFILFQLFKKQISMPFLHVPGMTGFNLCNDDNKDKFITNLSNNHKIIIIIIIIIILIIKMDKLKKKNTFT